MRSGQARDSSYLRTQSVNQTTPVFTLHCHKLQSIGLEGFVNETVIENMKQLFNVKNMLVQTK